MIGKVNPGKSFYNAVNYVMSKTGAVVLSASGVRFENPLFAAKDFEAVSKLSPRVNAHVWHASISFSPQETIGDQLMIQIAEDYIKSIGLEESQYLLVRHNDQAHPHFHIIANRIKYDGTVVSDKWSKNRTAKICDQLEKKYNLIVARDQNSKVEGRDKIPTAQYKKQLIKRAINHALSIDKAKTLEELKVSLAALQVEMRIQTQKTGRINGVSFRFQKLSVKGSTLGPDYKYKSLLQLVSKNVSKSKFLTIERISLGNNSGWEMSM